MPKKTVYTLPYNVSALCIRCDKEVLKVTNDVASHFGGLKYHATAEPIFAFLNSFSPLGFFLLFVNIISTSTA